VDFIFLFIAIELVGFTCIYFAIALIADRNFAARLGWSMGAVQSFPGGQWR
jgi:hypothetical protein